MGVETTKEREANSEDDILSDADEPTMGKAPQRRRAILESNKVQKSPKTHVPKRKSAQRSPSKTNGSDGTSLDKIPSGVEGKNDAESTSTTSCSQQGSDKDDERHEEDGRHCNEDGGDEEQPNTTQKRSRNKNPRMQPVIDKSSTITLEDASEGDDEQQVRKRKPRNKPYPLEIKVRNDRAMEQKHYDKKKECRLGKRPKKKTKKTTYVDSEDEESSQHNSDDDEQYLGNAKLAFSDATVAHDYTLLECFMRQAIHNFSPSSKYKKTVMYWSTKVSTSAAHMLVERHAHEIKNLIHRYGGQTPLEMRFGAKLRFLANNERAIQTRQIKNTFLSKQNPETRMAENLLETELDLDLSTPIRIHSNIAHIKSVTELQQLLVSSKMYQDQIVFNLFCLGLESGNFRQNKQRPFTPLNDLITKAHEAHFRVEIYLSLSKKSFRHHNTNSASAERVRLFNSTIIAVREGRQKYLKKAVEARMKSRNQRQMDDCERVGEQEENSDDYVDLEEDDL
jgi:hypothetical protein